MDKIESETLGIRAIVRRRYPSGALVEIVGAGQGSSILDQVAQKIADSFGGSWEEMDHPGASHIRLVHLPNEQPTQELAVKLSELK